MAIDRAGASLTGAIESPRPRSRPLAIAVDGRIVATTESTVVDGREVFVALLPRLYDGADRIRVFTAVGASRRLAELAP